jgi:uncharacterized protein
MADIYRRVVRARPETKREQVAWIRDHGQCGADRSCLVRSFRRRIAELSTLEEALGTGP